tara:strand:+ start:1974 stop:2210 length:237 start_codon:yes stop_codon:yes gene_type:complete
VSIERQPAVLATTNLRREVGQLQREKAQVASPARKGLLSSNKVVQSRMDSKQQSKTEIEKVMEAIAAIREGMSQKEDD